MLFAGSIDNTVQHYVDEKWKNLFLLGDDHLRPTVPNAPVRTAGHAIDMGKMIKPLHYATNPEINDGKPYKTLQGQERFPVGAKRILKALANAAKENPRYVVEAMDNYNVGSVGSFLQVEINVGILEVVNNFGLTDNPEFQPLVRLAEDQIKEHGYSKKDLRDMMPYKYLFEHPQENSPQRQQSEGKEQKPAVVPEAKEIQRLQRQISQLEEELYKADGVKRLVMQIKGLVTPGRTHQQIEADLLATRKRLDQETRVFRQGWGDCCELLRDKYFPGEEFAKDNKFSNGAITGIIRLFDKDKEFPNKAKLITDKNLIYDPETTKQREFDWMYGVVADSKYKSEFMKLTQENPESFTLLLKMLTADVFKYGYNVQDRYHKFLNSQSNPPPKEYLNSVIDAFTGERLGTVVFEKKDFLPERVSQREARREWDELLEELKKLGREETETTKPKHGRFEFKGHRNASIFDKEYRGCLTVIGGVIGIVGVAGGLIVGAENLILNNYVDYQVKSIDRTGKEASLGEYLASKLIFFSIEK